MNSALHIVGNPLNTHTGRTAIPMGDFLFCGYAIGNSGLADHCSLLFGIAGHWAVDFAECGQECGGFFPERAEHALVAVGREYGGYHLQRRHPQPGDRLGTRQRSGGQLGVVGVFAHRYADRVCLRPLVATRRCADRPRILRIAICREACGFFAWLSGGVLGGVFQCGDYGYRVCGGHQNGGGAAGH